MNKDQQSPDTTIADSSPATGSVIDRIPWLLIIGVLLVFTAGLCDLAGWSTEAVGFWGAGCFCIGIATGRATPTPNTKLTDHEP